MKLVKFAFFTIALLAIAVVGGFFYMGKSSQDGAAPGVADGRLAPCPDSPNCASSEEGTADDKKVDPLGSETWDAIPAAVAALGGEVTIEQDGYLATEFTSATFGFVDDVEFRRAEDGVHVRSASRVGYSDAGVNAERIAAIRAELN